MINCMMFVSYEINCWAHYENPQHNQVYAEKYAEDQDAFFRDYAEAHAKLSNLGAKIQPPQVGANIFVLSFPTISLFTFAVH